MTRFCHLWIVIVASILNTNVLLSSASSSQSADAEQNIVTKVKVTHLQSSQITPTVLSKSRAQFIRRLQEHSPHLNKQFKSKYYDELLREPEKCLPKYICILKSKEGTRTTAVLSSLHPLPPNTNLQPGFPHGGRPPSHPRRPPPSKEVSSNEEEEEKKKNDASGSNEEEEDDNNNNSGVSSREDEDDRGRNEDEDDDINSEEMAHRMTTEKTVAAKNDTDSGGMFSKLKSYLMPSFSLSLFSSSSSSNADKVEGRSAKTLATGNSNVESYLRRVKRKVEQEKDDLRKFKLAASIGGELKDPEHCQLLFNGCKLSYDEIMRLASAGAVEVERDPVQPPPEPVTSFKKPGQKKKPDVFEDDEFDQAQKDKPKKPGTSGYRPIVKFVDRRKKKKVEGEGVPTKNHIVSGNQVPHPPQFIPQRYPVPHQQQFHPQLPQNIRFPRPLPPHTHVQGPYGHQHPGFRPHIKPPSPMFGNSNSVYNQIHKRPSFTQPHDDNVPLRKPFAGGLPILPIKLAWGKPYQVGPLKGTLLNQRPTIPPPTTTTTKPTVKPLFSPSALDKKQKRKPSVTVYSNKTHHAVVANEQTPYQITRTRFTDKYGNPLNYATVFAEVAGSSGTIHDEFEKISRTIATKDNVILTLGEKAVESKEESAQNDEKNDEEDEDDVKSSEEAEDREEEDERNDKQNQRRNNGSMSKRRRTNSKVSKTDSNRKSSNRNRLKGKLEPKEKPKSRHPPPVVQHQSMEYVRVPLPATQTHQSKPNFLSALSNVLHYNRRIGKY